MDLSLYQHEAEKTDRAKGQDGNAIMVPLLGLAGEVGSLLAEYKKFLRDGPAHRLFKEQISEDLGDILWYVSNAATKFGLDLGQIATANLAKTRDRWPVGPLPQYKLYDDDYPDTQRFPRVFNVVFAEVEDGNRTRVIITADGSPFGDPLTDNAYEDDGYRFHDIFHLSYTAILGWSPVSRAGLKCKRRKDLLVDEVEDGGRAVVIDEAISAFVYDYAKKANYLENVDTVDYQLLKTIKSLTAELEVKTRSYADWERAILNGYSVWRTIWRNRGGVVAVDMLNRTIACHDPNG
jgi:NTP pyrophosphatase (non-canonical NTP hydrolase)